MSSLKGHFLIATPGMADERFSESVVYLVGHGEDGAMGLVVNHRLPNLSAGDIFGELELGPPDELIRVPERIRKRAVLLGGPVETGRGFVLHSRDYFRAENSYEVNDEIGLTATLDVLRAIAFGSGPAQSLLALGYCGWAPGQLEHELRGNGWLTAPHSRDILFEVPVERRYEAALASIGVNRAALSGDIGNA
ncbi:MAG: YqgE/AlgH family protein [Alphaproteobacteria bacterium]|nr:YqgE/AlgH family protein [Alphaproteobacteria bacterium]